MTTETCTSPEALQQKLLSRADELSMLPAVATEALEMARDPECKTAEFAGVIERDVKLATEILSTANSVMFAATTPVSSLRQAIVRLGIKQCRNLILSSSAASLMKSLPLEQESVREIIWQHSFRTATTCAQLNTSMNVGFEGEEFTAGLLHDFGRLLLAVAAPEEFPRADTLSFEEDEEFLSRETAVLGIDHCQFGAWFAKHNRLPRSLVAAIQFHHLPEMHHPDSKLIALVAAADHLASFFQRSGDRSQYDVELNRGAHALARLGYPQLLKAGNEIIRVLFEDVLSETGHNVSLRS